MRGLSIQQICGELKIRVEYVVVVFFFVPTLRFSGPPGRGTEYLGSFVRGIALIHACSPKEVVRTPRRYRKSEENVAQRSAKLPGRSILKPDRGQIVFL